MFKTYFCFSDECGDYQRGMNSNQTRAHPYYIRSTLILNSAEWKTLNHGFSTLKDKYRIPLSVEIKWSDLWEIRRYQLGTRRHLQKKLKQVQDIEYHQLIAFVEESLSLLHDLNEKKIIITYTKNPLYIAEEKLLAFHLQDHMQRVQMELKSYLSDCLAVIYFDPVNKRKNELFRNAYHELFRNGDFIEKYSCIKDSINFENSHQSVGIQIADYISGSFSSILKTGLFHNNYTSGIKMFFDSVYPFLRKDDNNNIFGRGIREVPSNIDQRKDLREKINTLLKNQMVAVG